jgi:16S rRNA (cytosine1402-N4)-methyltransferase
MIDHTPVLRDEVVRLLAPRPDGVIVDGTVGLGGHAEALLEAGPTGRLIGIDRDPEALARAHGRLARFGSRVSLVHGDYRDLERLLDGLGVDRIDGLLLDLGLSSLQLDDASRGFSFRLDGPLDMRADPTDGETAAEWIASAPRAEIAEVLAGYGEERYADRIARAIDEARRREPIATTASLAAIVRAAVPASYRRGRIDPATRTFQAIRIRVNGELDALEGGLRAGFDRLAHGGVLVVVSFHSLEDRIVKRFFREKAADCVCPPELPECVCDKQVEAEVLTKRPVTPTAAEIEANPRARSAKLRAARKVV